MANPWRLAQQAERQRRAIQQGGGRAGMFEQQHGEAWLGRPCLRGDDEPAAVEPPLADNHTAGLGLRTIEAQADRRKAVSPRLAHRLQRIRTLVERRPRRWRVPATACRCGRRRAPQPPRAARRAGQVRSRKRWRCRAGSRQAGCPIPSARLPPPRSCRRRRPRPPSARRVPPPPARSLRRGRAGASRPDRAGCRSPPGRRARAKAGARDAVRRPG